ncbi:MAG: DNA adenine methylase [Bacteroides sp.]|nr:DNA adenine methylase [Bacteroides sp.]
MRYIGNKENILDNIFTILTEEGVTGTSFFDFFAGTSNVGKYFKKKGFQIYSCDILYLSYCLQKAYIENNEIPSFDKIIDKYDLKSSIGALFESNLDKVLKYLDALLPVEGFIYKNFTPGGTADLARPRMYFIDDNGKKIDAIRQQIEEWRAADLLSENEYYILLSCLIESISFHSNVAGVYAAFQKKWDPRALKPLVLRPIEILKSELSHKVFNRDSILLAPEIDVDILYLDPPYNERQYLPNYHLVETIAKYDNPEVRGVTGMREYKSEKSSFCNPKTAIRDLEKIASQANYKYLVLSYNSEGIMPQTQIIETLSKFGSVTLRQFQYARFKSNNNGLSKTKKHVFEQLYILKHETVE